MEGRRGLFFPLSLFFSLSLSLFFSSDTTDAIHDTIHG